MRVRAFCFALLLRYVVAAFLKTAKVTVTGRVQKSLAEVVVGEQVLSWDEIENREVWSVVRAIHVVNRPAEELIQLQLPHAAIYATEDHPFWSNTKGRVVAMRPGQTREEHGIAADVMAEDEGVATQDNKTIHMRLVQCQNRSSLVGVSGSFDATAGKNSKSKSHHNGTGVSRETEEHGEKDVEVITLSLAPHHWFYVEGVRVHNKGCFIGSTDVTLKNGSRRSLDSLRIGDEVWSWNETLQEPAISTVRGVPSFRRPAAEIFKLTLNSGSELVVTEDHPLWSRARKGVAALNPEQTMQQYSMEASVLELLEELEDERQDAIKVTSIEPYRLPVVVSAMASNDGWSAEERDQEEQMIIVKTLCLEPHHWFYAEGVRVHNKGCFEPTTPILMSNGEEKPISEIHPEDKVLSWNSTANSFSEASVIQVDVHPATEALLEVTVTVDTDRTALKEDVKERRMVVTADHPLYSSRVDTIVSMLPNKTLANYGLHASQMLEDKELLHHHSGQTCRALTRPVQSNSSARPNEVMTLQLDKHHWFFAHGVRVHNKGGGGGGFSGGGGYYGGGSSYHPMQTRQSMGLHGFATLVVLEGGSRRRYGVYQNEGYCTLASNSSITSACKIDVMSQTTPTCPWTDFPANRPSCASKDYVTREECGAWCCSDCMACENMDCVARIPGCESFLAWSFTECRDKYEWIGNLFWGVCFACCCAACFCSWATAGKQPAELIALRDQRLRLEAGNCKGLTTVDFHGHYSELGDSKPCSYSLTFTGDGQISGIGTDDDGTATVNGTLAWFEGDQGKIAFVEQRTGATIEMEGTLTSVGDHEYLLSASYVSSYRSTHGNLSVRGRPGVPAPGANGRNQGRPVPGGNNSSNVNNINNAPRPEGRPLIASREDP